MADRVVDNPIINRPYDEPSRHFRFDDAGITNEIVESRRVSAYFVPVPRSRKGAQQLAFAELTADQIRANQQVNQVRERVKIWRQTGSANLFTVFGEPDVRIAETTVGLVVEIKGVDVYNPTTGEIRSNGTSEIAMWMLDTSYDEESFFVRHCYFHRRGHRPVRQTQAGTTRRDHEATWATLYSTRSRPFPTPPTGKIAVNVINHYGAEVLKVYEVSPS